MRDAYDVVVVGAGPAGSLAARGAALAGKRVLLVDKAPFPRGKVCGCCLNASALATLHEAGLSSILSNADAPRLRELSLHCAGRSLSLPLPPGHAVSRRVLDASLADAASAAGAAFAPGWSASLDAAAAGEAPHRLTLRAAGASRLIEARVLVVADGLGGRLLDGVPGFDATVAPLARIGAGATLPPDGADLPPGRVRMVVGRGGYVGLVRLEDGSLDVAAALDLARVQQHGGPGRATLAIFRRAGVSPPAGLTDAAWRGTPKLTRRRRRIAGHRLFVIGDAAGYVEPFTGEGIAWAMAGGLAVAPLAVVAAGHPDASLAGAWSRRHASLVRQRQRWCRAVAIGLRSPRLVAASIAIADRAPSLPVRLLGRIAGASPAYAAPAGHVREGAPA